MKKFLPLLLLATACGSTPSESDVKITGGSNINGNTNDARSLSTVALTNLKLANEGHSFCTGTLYNRRVVITAAHCLVNENGGPTTTDQIFVSFGNRVSPSSLKIRVTRTIAHPQYDARLNLTRNPQSPSNDIGLVYLETDAPYPYMPTDIFEQQYADRQQFTAVGFGVSSSRNSNDTGVLRQVNLSLRAVEGVARRFTTMNYFQGTCAGDSGGPAYVQSNGRYLLAGITSTGVELFGTCLLGQNSFTDARHYLQWVRQNLNGLGGGFPPIITPVNPPVINPPIVVPPRQACELQPQQQIVASNDPSAQANMLRARLLFSDVARMQTFIPQYNGVVMNPWVNECQGYQVTGTASCEQTRKRIAVWRALQGGSYLIFSTDQEVFYARDVWGRSISIASLAEIMPQLPSPLTQNTPTMGLNAVLMNRVRNMYPNCQSF